MLILRSVRPRRDFPRAGRQVDGNGIDFSNAVFDEQTGNTLHSIYMYKEVSSVGWFHGTIITHEPLDLKMKNST